MYKRRQFDSEESQQSEAIRRKLEYAELLIKEIKPCKEREESLSYIEKAMLYANLAITNAGV